MITHDYKVSVKTEEEIALVASDARVKLGFEDAAKLDMVKMFERLFGRKVGAKGILGFELVDHHPDEPVAEVRFKPFTLRVERDVWHYAKFGDPHSRFILAHEMGHVLMHSAEAKAFTGREENFGIYGFQEHSGEWQADTFAGHLLVPDQIVLEIKDASKLAIHCDVERKLATERINSAKRRKLIKPRIEGDVCSVCGGFVGLRGRCPDCKK